MSKPTVPAGQAESPGTPDLVSVYGRKLRISDQLAAKFPDLDLDEAAWQAAKKACEASPEPGAWRPEGTTDSGTGDAGDFWRVVNTAHALRRKRQHRERLLRKNVHRVNQPVREPDPATAVEQQDERERMIAAINMLKAELLTPGARAALEAYYSDKRHLGSQAERTRRKKAAQRAIEKLREAIKQDLSRAGFDANPSGRGSVPLERACPPPAA